MVEVVWKNEMAFEVHAGNKTSFMLDAAPESGGHGLGPRPLEALLGALGGCTGMDVISILTKKRQKVTSYKLQIEGDRVPEGEMPRPYTSIRVKHILKGEDLDPISVQRAVELSDQKYCHVMATLRTKVNITTSWEVLKN